MVYRGLPPSTAARHLHGFVALNFSHRLWLGLVIVCFVLTLSTLRTAPNAPREALLFWGVLEGWFVLAKKW